MARLIRFPEVPRSSPISDETLSKFLMVLGARPDATVAALAGEAQVTERMVKKYLQALKERGVIRRVGSNRRGRWVLITPAFSVANGTIDSVPQSSPKFPEVPQSSPISDETLSKFLMVLGARPDATVAALAGEAQVTERMVKKYLQALKERGVIRRVGSNRRGRWEIL